MVCILVGGYVHCLLAPDRKPELTVAADGPVNRPVGAICQDPPWQSTDWESR